MLRTGVSGTVKTRNQRLTTQQPGVAILYSGVAERSASEGLWKTTSEILCEIARGATVLGGMAQKDIVTPLRMTAKGRSPVGVFSLSAKMT